MSIFYVDARIDRFCKGEKPYEYLESIVKKGDKIYIVFCKRTLCYTVEHITMKMFALCQIQFVPCFNNTHLDDVAKMIATHILINDMFEQSKETIYILGNQEDFKPYMEDLLNIGIIFKHYKYFLTSIDREREQQFNNNVVFAKDELLKNDEICEILPSKKIHIPSFEDTSESEQSNNNIPLSTSEQNKKNKQKIETILREGNYTKEEIKAILRGRNIKQSTQIINNQIDDRLNEVIKRALEKAKIEEKRIEQILDDLSNILFTQDI